MNKIFKFLMAALLVSSFATVSAQCIAPNAPGPPRYWDGERGCYVPQGTPALANASAWQQQQQLQQQQYQQQLQQQWQLQQQAIRVPVGQAVPGGYCSWGGRAENVIGGAIIGAIIGNLYRDNRQATQRGAAVGALAGVFVPCSTLQQQQVVVQQPQGVVTQQGVQQNPCANQPGRVAVYRANGAIACRAVDQPGEPGERPYP